MNLNLLSSAATTTRTAEKSVAVASSGLALKSGLRAGGVRYMGLYNSAYRG